VTVNAAIVLERVSKTYVLGHLEVHALQEVSVSIAAGELVAVMGPSGSGKSTFMNIVGCLDAPTDGRYLLDGVEVGALGERRLAEIRNREIGFVFQSFNLLPRTTALQNVMLPLTYARVPAKERRRRALAALEAVGLADRVAHRSSELSGGQQQRVAIARAIVTDPAIVLADEPTGNLDSAAAAEVLSLLVELNDAGRTIVLITHEPEVAAAAERVVRLRDGRVVADERRRLPAA
jgi:putative ABC transport system ATP-binding protein